MFSNRRRATFLTDYVHTVMILIIIFVFAFTTYATSDVLGSPSKVYDLLVKAAEAHPVDGNAGGSYLTMQVSHFDSLQLLLQPTPILPRETQIY